MNTKKIRSIAVGLAVSLLLVASAQTAEKKPQMSEEMQAQMAKAKEAGTPGAEHAVLKPLEGNWTVTSRSWMKPGEKPQQSSGTSSMSWVLGGRFLKQDYKGEWMGQPFEGMDYLGYDKIRKEYVSVWLDNMSTGLFQGAGQYDATTKTISQTGTFSCPFTGDKNMWYRSEWKIVKDDMNVFNMYMKDPAGKEYKSMEITYKRAK
jgi:ABC-type transport system substrate-binding protein